MIKVTEIIEAKPYTVICKLSDGTVKHIDVMPLLEKHKHLEGIEKLYDKDIFSKASVGKFGEILWKDIVTTYQENTPTVWDYDISPEFVAQCAD
jgi:hypothetical protein